MKKLNLSSRQLQAFYPPMSQAFENTVQRTLTVLESGKEQPRMKKKISATLVFVAVLILLTISAAIALTSSDLLTVMFGNSQPPKEVEELLSKPEATIATPDIKLTLDEYLYDGEKLHLRWSLESLTDKQIMVTMDPIQINGKKVNAEREISFRAYSTWGQILGGEADGIAMPESFNWYNIYANPVEGMSGYYTFHSGEALEITSNLYVWELLSPPDVIEIDGQTKKGFLDVPSLHGMPTFSNGLGGLGFLQLNECTKDVYNDEKNLDVYEEMGWAKLLYQQPMQFSLALNAATLEQVTPVETSFVTKDFALEVSRMVYMTTGGTLEFRLLPNPEATTWLNMTYDFVILNADSKEMLSNYADSVCSDGISVNYTAHLAPTSGSMPKAILIIPTKENPAWNQDHSSVYPDLSEPDDNDSQFLFLMEDAVRVELK